MSNRRYVWFLRGTTYITAGTLGALILSAAMPPLLTATSERALVNAPVITLTAPIAGMVDPISLGEGEDLPADAAVARIDNPRIDRATLTHLEIRLVDVADKRDHAEHKAQTLRAAIERLDAEFDDKVTAMQRLRATELAALTARLAEAKAEREVARVFFMRQRTLGQRKIVSQSIIDEAMARLRASAERVSAAHAAIGREREIQKALEGRVFVGEGLEDLALIANELRERRLDLAEAERTAQTASVHYDELTQLADAERARIDTRTASTVRMPSDGRITTSFASRGQDVAAGETLAHAIDCSAQRVVAIFPQRHGDDLTKGRTVTVTGDGFAGAVDGYVERVLPHTTEMMDKIFAVPFPPIERRELYAVIALSDGASDAQDGCHVGEWVSVSLNAGLVHQAVSSVVSIAKRVGATTVAFASTSPTPAEDAAMVAGD